MRKKGQNLLNRDSEIIIYNSYNREVVQIRRRDNVKHNIKKLGRFGLIKTKENAYSDALKIFNDKNIIE